MNIAMIEQKVASPKVKKFSGVHATFCRLNRKWGVKFFETKEERDMNYEIMENLHAHGIAPEVRTKVSFEWINDTYYGFLIEIVKPVENVILRFFNIERSQRRRGYGYCSMVCPDGIKYKEFMLAHSEYDKMFNELHEKCYSVDFVWEDDHAGNWGINADGKAVIFDVSVEAEEAMDSDCDEESCSPW